MGDDQIDSVISHIIRPYPITIPRMTIWWMIISITNISYRLTISHTDILLMSDLPYRYPISIADHILSLWFAGPSCRGRRRRRLVQLSGARHRGRHEEARDMEEEARDRQEGAREREDEHTVI
jgi:hypothetical protein